MKKIISVLAMSAIVTTTVFSGCNVKVKVNENIPTKPTQATTAKTDETTANAEEDFSLNYNYETIATTEPPAFDDNYALNTLLSNGYDENYLRKSYSFDDKDLNCENNKNYVLDRMCNSVDYFTTIQASYTKKVNSKNTFTEYIIDRRISKAKELVYNISENKKCTPTQYVFADGDYHSKMLFNDESKGKYSFEYTSLSDLANNDTLLSPLSTALENVTAKPSKNSSSENIEIKKYIDATKRFIYKNGKINGTLRRGDNNIGLIHSTEHYLDQGFALDSLYDYSSWEIVSADDNVIHIKGSFTNLNGNYDRNFELEIDKNTGVPISKKIYNTSDALLEEWTCVKLIVDGEIDEKIFDTIN